MLDKMKQMKQLMDMQKKAKAMQKELRETEIEAESSDGKITVVFNGELKLVDLSIGEAYMNDHSVDDLEKVLKTTIAEAMSKAQQVAAERTRDIMKDMNINLPGM
jgi:DNA-binding YbaB/EbfC family protein